MKKLFLVSSAFLMVVGVYLLSLASSNDALALSGCCKVRKAENVRWRRVKNDFPSCKKLNQKNDKDNVFKRRGKVWWDTSC